MEGPLVLLRDEVVQLQAELRGTHWGSARTLLGSFHDLKPNLGFLPDSSALSWPFLFRQHTCFAIHLFLYELICVFGPAKGSDIFLVLVFIGQPVGPIIIAPHRAWTPRVIAVLYSLIIMDIHRVRRLLHVWIRGSQSFSTELGLFGSSEIRGSANGYFTGLDRRGATGLE